MQTCVVLCVGELCYVYRTMCKNINLYIVLSTPILWYCVSHSFTIFELNKIYIIHVCESYETIIVVYIILRFLNVGLQKV